MKQTAMHWAAKRGFVDMIELLLEYGADIDADDLVKIFISFTFRVEKLLFIML